MNQYKERMRMLLANRYHHRLYNNNEPHHVWHPCPCSREADYMIELIGDEFDEVERIMAAARPLTECVAEIAANGCRADRLMARTAMEDSVKCLEAK